MERAIWKSSSRKFAAICATVLILLLAKLSTTHGQSDNSTTATETNTTTEAVTGSPHRTTMSYTFIARPNATGGNGETPGNTPDSPPQPQQRYNASVLEGVFRDYEPQYLEHNKLEFLKESEECALRQMFEVELLDYDAPEDGRYCGSYFDTIMCWPASPPGTVYLPCPEVLNDVHYDTSFNVTRYCDFDGTWGFGNKSNYSMCTAKFTPQFSGHDVALQVLVYVGYSLSFTALVGAFCIFLFFRSLRCVRNYIHWNLVSSFVLLYVAYFATSAAANAVKTKPELIWLCRVLLSMTLYVLMTNFFWMFVEGVYLYTLVVRALTVRRNYFWIYCLFGWGVPVPFIILFAVMKKSTASDCWVSMDKYTYIIMIPIFTVIAFNLYFLVHIMAILITKLRASHSLETQQYRKGVKGTLFLLPLLGVTYLLFLLGPVQVDDVAQTASSYVYYYFNTLLSSMQGFFVAVIYVYLNQDVQNVIKRKMRRWREESTLPTRVASRRGSNTRTSFGNLGLFGGRRSVQSGNAGDNSEHVTAFKLPGGKTSPDAYSNGSKVPPFIRLDEVQPLTPVSDAPTSPRTLYSSLSSGNGNNTEEHPGTQSGEEGVDETPLEKGPSEPTDCKELPLLSVNVCGTVQPISAIPDSSYGNDLDSENPDSENPDSENPDSENLGVQEEKLLHGGLDNGIPNGNHNNNNSLTPCLAKAKRSSSPLAGRSRVTFADELQLENHKRPVCCDPSKSPDIHGRGSPTRRPDSERHPTRGHSDGEDSPDAGSGKKDPQRSPLLPCLRKKPWASSKPNGTIAFQKAPDGTPV